MVRFGKMTEFATFGVAVLLLAGCSFPSGPVGLLAPVDMATIVATDKTLLDHVVSFSSGKDCSTVRIENDQTYCVEDQERNRDPEAIYCYKSLGDISCFREIDPYRQNQQTVAGNIPTKPIIK